MDKYGKYQDEFHQAEVDAWGEDLGSWWPEVVTAIEKGGKICWEAQVFIPHEMIKDLQADGWRFETEVMSNQPVENLSKIICDWES